MNHLIAEKVKNKVTSSYVNKKQKSLWTFFCGLNLAMDLSQKRKRKKKGASMYYFIKKKVQEIER